VDFESDANQPTKGLVELRPGGFQALFGDGSVRLISEAIDPVTLMRLFTRADGQPVRLD
jgi:prepilin-type processing-associated H-X9-DG protein